MGMFQPSWPVAPPPAASRRPQERAASNWARRRLTRGQRVGLVCLVFLLAIAAILAPRATIEAAVAICIGLSVAHTALRALAWAIGQWPQAAHRPIATSDLPLYSIIVPLYGEANMIGHLVAALGALDYPHDRLDALLAVEHDDEETLTALAGAELPQWIRVVVVPPGAPRTKPRACQHALSHARGVHVVVYDAEDVPDPGQLRAAVAAFAHHGPATACLQASLVPDNRRENWLTAMFALDYCQWFDGMLAGFQRLGLPVPLGGSSNHFRTAALRAAGGWDSWNVTEDADLGIRLWRLGHGVRTLASTTWEEAPLTLDAWLPQRTRWSRGYLQTFLVHARRPVTLGLPGLGLAGWAFLIVFVGGSIVFALVNPLFWGLATYTLLTGAGAMEWAFGPAVAPLAWASLVFGNALAMTLTALGPLRRGWWGLSPLALTSPVYWALVSAASYRALYVLAVHPFRWEKTAHGLARTRRGQAP